MLHLCFFLQLDAFSAQPLDLKIFHAFYQSPCVLTSDNTLDPDKCKP